MPCRPPELRYSPAARQSPADGQVTVVSCVSEAELDGTGTVAAFQLLPDR
jgi:hypothetical protein